MKHNVWLSQVNYTYGQASLFLPYSAGCLEAYARAQEEIESSFNFCGYIYRRELIADVIARIERSGGVDVLGISCYIWNWEYSKGLAEAVRARWPESVIVIGGPQVSTGGDPFGDFRDADVVVFGEGELAFAAILRAYDTAAQCGVEHQGAVRRGDHGDVFGAIHGLAINLGERDACFTREPQRIADLAPLPSPYLAGCFDGLLTLPYDWQACQETNRGCPYSCSFCAWGPESLAKIHQFPEERIIKELQWMGEHQIRYLYSCDANYGSLKRDIDLTRVLTETKKLYGFPKEFRACTAKNSNDRVFEISQILNEAGMCKGATLSFQSMDPHTLQVIKRKNIKIDDFKERLQLYRKHGIATYTELILGLPGESLASFEAGIDTILDAGKHEGMNIYLCQVLPQTDFIDPAYQEAHDIVAVRSPILMQHSAPTVDPHQEYNDIIIGTSTMPDHTWINTYMFAWAVQTFHCLGLSRFLAMFARHELEMKYSAFYNGLLNWAFAHRHETQIGEAYLATLDTCERGMGGGDWGTVDQRFGNIVWPTEEISFLRLATRHGTVYNELRAFMIQLMTERDWHATHVSLRKVANDLIDYQESMLILPDDIAPILVDMKFNCHSYFSAILDGKPIKFVPAEEEVIIKPRQSYESLEEYARLVCWYGRKGGRFTQSDIIHYSKE